MGWGKDEGWKGTWDLGLGTGVLDGPGELVTIGRSGPFGWVGEVCLVDGE